MKFSLLTLVGDGAREADLAFFPHTTDDLTDPERRFALTSADLALLNPNTRTMPVFRARRDAELTTKIYHNCPVWMDETKDVNP